jgi:hypothetical protein
MHLWQLGYVIGLAIALLWTVVMPGVIAVSSALHLIVRWNLVAWPPPNTTFVSWWRPPTPRPSTKIAQVGHAYSRATV